MSATECVDAGRLPHIAPRLSPTGRIVVLASVAAMFLATSSAPTPVYSLYSRDWGLSAGATALVFGTYALSLLAALLTLGRLSDHVGRRPVLLVTLAVQVVGMVVFASADGLSGLLVGRVLQGLSTGAGLAAVGSALVDTDARRGITANAAAPALGSAVGVLGAAVLVTYAPAPERTVYLVLAVLLLIEAWLVLGLPETSAREPGIIADLRPRARVPVAARTRMLAAAPVLFAVWALSGLFGSLGPRLVHQVTGSPSAVYGALPLTIVGAVSPVTAYAMRTWPPRRSLVTGIAALTVGVALTIGAGILVEHTGSLTGTTLGYGAVLIALALFAAAALGRKS